MATYLIGIPVVFVLGVMCYEAYKYLSKTYLPYHPNIADINTAGLFNVVKSFALGALGMTLFLIFG